ncbi:MAG: MYXO-CTERM sorting domain-containing protein, partial [Myxococcales bacterium]|nr:MYXO-CTERM sorting domain-containing protein [Myxococcales bacterium]
EAQACSCLKLSPSEGLAASQAVFTGEVIAIEPNETTKFGGLAITLRVKQVWKGALQQQVEVHTAGSSAACGYSFVQGTTYLVYAVRDDADPMRVSLCSRTARVDDAQEDLDFLGKPAQRFDDPGVRRKSEQTEANAKADCSASPASTASPSLGLFALMLLGVALAFRRRKRGRTDD